MPSLGYLAEICLYDAILVDLPVEMGVYLSEQICVFEIYTPCVPCLRRSS